VALLGEQHLRHLPMVYLDQRTTYQLSFDETSDKSEVYIVNRRCFAIAGGCALIFREGQDDIYGNIALLSRVVFKSYTQSF
jgi:hypothetical protein